MLYSDAEWDTIRFETQRRMGEYVYPFTTPISRATSFDEGESLGTGNYIRVADEPHLLPNEHVARPARTATVTHLPVPDGNFVRISEMFVTWTWPLDIAITKLVDPVTAEKSQILSLAAFDEAYSPVDGELLFWIGYPGTTAKRTDVVATRHKRYSRFGELPAPAVPFVTRASAITPRERTEGYHPDFHVAIEYPLIGVTGVSAEPQEVPHPSGMSGSLLWDTKRVACQQQGFTWAPDLAKVCGIIWAAYREPDVILATRVQFIRECIDAVVDK